MTNLNESILEDAALSWLDELGYAIAHGPHIDPGEPATEPACAHADRRDSFADVVLVGRLREAIRRLNPAIPEKARATYRKYLSVEITTKYGRAHE